MDRIHGFTRRVGWTTGLALVLLAAGCGGTADAPAGTRRAGPG